MPPLNENCSGATTPEQSKQKSKASNNPIITDLFRNDTTIFSALSEHLPMAQLAYWVARASDRTGSGYFSLSISDVAIILERSERSIIRHFKKCWNLGLFRYLQINGDRVTGYYSSLSSVAIAFGLADSSELGVCFRVQIHELSQLRAIATEATTEGLQRAARHQKRIELQQVEKHNIVELPNVEPLADPKLRKRDSSDYPWGQDHVIHFGPAATFVDDQYPIYGASLEGIATQLGRSPSTVQRRLSNKWRSTRNKALSDQGKRLLQPIKKRQIYQLSDLNGDRSLRFDKWIAEHCFDIDALELYRKTYQYRSEFYEARTNVYSLPVEVVGRRHFRNRFNKVVSQVQSALDAIAALVTDLKEFSRIQFKVISQG